MTIQDFFRVFLGIQIKLEWFWVLKINLGICTLNGKDLSITVDSKQRAGCTEFPTAENVKEFNVKAAYEFPYPG